MKANKLNMPFQHRENITYFLRAVRKHIPGLKESDLFSTDDVYEGKNIPQVIRCIYNIGGVIQADPKYDPEVIPRLGIAQKAKTKPDTRRESGIANQMEHRFVPARG